MDHQDLEGNTALHYAAMHNHFDVASFLTLAGTDQTLKNVAGQTAYDVAVAKKHDKLAATLGCILNTTESTDEGSVMMRVICAQNNPKHPKYNPKIFKHLCINHLEKLAVERGEEYIVSEEEEDEGYSDDSDDSEGGADEADEEEGEEGGEDWNDEADGSEGDGEREERDEEESGEEVEDNDDVQEAKHQRLV